MDTSWLLGLVVPVGPGRMVGVVTHRPRGRSDFTPADRAHLQRHARPLQAALRLRDRLEAQRLAGVAALDALAFAAVVCDGAGRVVFANRAAEAMAGSGDGFSLGTRHGGPLAAGSPAQTEHLLHLMRSAVVDASAGAMAVTGAAGAIIPLLVTPLPRRFGQATPLALVTARPTAATRMADAATLAALFALTPTEAEVAAALSTGAAVAEIAHEFGVGEETVRTHVKRCLMKAGVSSQREFVALMGRLPPVAG